MSARLRNIELKEWAQFYLRLAAVRAWNAATQWAKVFTGGAIVNTTGLVDLSKLDWKVALGTLVGTVLFNIAFAWSGKPLPEPTPPSVNTPTEL